MSSVDEKPHTLKSNLKCKSVNSIFNECEVKNAMLSLKEDFVIIPLIKTANNVDFFCIVLTIIKGLNFNCHLSNQNDSNTCTFINKKAKGHIIKEYKLYLSKHKNDLTNNI